MPSAAFTTALDNMIAAFGAQQKVAVDAATAPLAAQIGTLQGQVTDLQGQLTTADADDTKALVDATPVVPAPASGFVAPGGS